MEAGSGLKQIKMITIVWDGDWESCKQTFEATADLNGIHEAITGGQLLAEQKRSWPWFSRQRLKVPTK